MTIGALFVLTLSLAPVAAGPPVIEFWQTQDATIPAIEALAEAFNAAQENYQVVPRLATWYDANPMARVGLEQLTYAAPSPQLAAYAVWQEYLEEALERSRLGGMAPEEALALAQRRAEAER